MKSKQYQTSLTSRRWHDADRQPHGGKSHPFTPMARAFVNKSNFVAASLYAVLVLTCLVSVLVLTGSSCFAAPPASPSPPEFRVGFFNIYLGLARAPHRDAVVRQIQRVQPDIMGLSEINDADHSRLPTLVEGLPNVVTQPGGLQPALITRYPVLSSGSLGSTAPANEFKRKHLWAVLDVGHATRNLLVYVIHTESWCYAAPCANVARPALEFPRAIEWIRLKQDIQAKLKGNPQLDVIVMGDWNDDNQSSQTDVFASQPDGIFKGFSLGVDIAFPVQHGPYPNYQCQQAGLHLLDSNDTDGKRHTIWEGKPNPAFSTAVKMDYISHSSGVTATGHEILNSEVSDPAAGLPKYGKPLAFGDSRAASDHLMIFADMTME